MWPCPACRVGRSGAAVLIAPLALCMFAVSAVKAHSGSQISGLRGGGPRTLPTQPWLIEGLPPEEDPAGNIWETQSWRERIRQHQEEKAARKWTEHDAYGPVHYMQSQHRSDEIANTQHLVPEHVKKRFAAAAAMLNEQNDRRRSSAAKADGDGVGGGQSVAASEAVRTPAGGWDADKCASTEQGRAGGEGEERRADEAD